MPRRRRTAEGKRHTVACALCGLNATTPCLPWLTGKQGYGNTINPLPRPEPVNGRHRPPPVRDIPGRQRAFGAHAAGMDQAPAHPASPPRALRLLRSVRGFRPYPHQIEGASPRLTPPAAITPHRFPVRLFTFVKSATRVAEWDHCSGSRAEALFRPKELQGIALGGRKTKRCVSFPIHRTTPGPKLKQTTGVGMLRFEAPN